MLQTWQELLATRDSNNIAPFHKFLRRVTKQEEWFETIKQMFRELRRQENDVLHDRLREMLFGDEWDNNTRLMDRTGQQQWCLLRLCDDDDAGFDRPDKVNQASRSTFWHNITHVDVNNTSIQDLSPLRHLNRLIYLNVEGCPVTDAGIASLEHTPELLYLDFTKTKLTDRGLRVLQHLPKLRSLRLSSTQLTDAGLAHLGHKPDLDFLYLTNTSVTDAVLEHLRDLPRLEVIYVLGTRLTAVGYHKLRKMYPSIDIREKHEDED